MGRMNHMLVVGMVVAAAALAGVCSARAADGSTKKASLFVNGSGPTGLSCAVSGPANSRVTAMPSGSRWIARKNRR